MDGLRINGQNQLMPDLQKTQKIEKATTGESFSSTLNQAIKKVDNLQKVADHKMEELSAGKTNNIPEVMIAAEKADIALRLMVQMRNKMIDAYQEIMKMQV